jgi:hypothetical protein
MSRPFDDSYFNRNILVDVYPRKDDPFKPSVAPGAIDQGPGGDSALAALVAGFVTPPGQRPVVYQRGLNFNFAVTAVPQPLQANRYDVDSFVIDVPATAANSVFVGFAGVTATSGLECRAGIPIEIATDNTREQWELQRSLEALVAMLAYQNGLPLPFAFKSPRVVFNLADIFIVAAANTNISVMAFNVPEMQ